MDKIKNIKVIKYMMRNLLSISIIALALYACKEKPQEEKDDIASNTISVADQQISFQVKLIEKSGKILNPRTVKNGLVQYVPIDDWTSGFFPGTMWYMYELTGNEKWKNYGIKYTEHLDSSKYLTWHHDIGFII
ncbi:MAG TPA: glucuronyl hydrolase, partial [Candidatus Enterocola sp.]|nr:glucuronyl hydrolase [Candidatus Enterocola sp.]